MRHFPATVHNKLFVVEEHWTAVKIESLKIVFQGDKVKVHTWTDVTDNCDFDMLIMLKMNGNELIVKCIPVQKWTFSSEFIGIVMVMGGTNLK